MNSFAERVAKRGAAFYLSGCIDFGASDGCYRILMLVEGLCQAERWSSMGRSLVAAHMLNRLSELAGRQWQFHVPFGPPFDRVIKSVIHESRLRSLSFLPPPEIK
jgi:hypothetical protein